MNVQNPVDRAVLGITGPRPTHDQAAQLREKRAAAAQTVFGTTPSKPAAIGVRTLDPRIALGSIPKTNPAAAASGLLGTSDPAAVPSDPSSLTVDGLLAAWGKNDSNYDLDGDGTVGMSDLTELLSRIETNGPPRPAGDAIASVPGGATRNDGGISDLVGTDGRSPEALGAPADDTAPGLTVDGLLGQWGQKGSEYDLDGDGVVGMGDLVQLLARLQPPADGGAPSVDAAADPTALADLGTDAPPAEVPALTVDGLLAAWGQRNDAFDLDGDGIVGMTDLIELLSRQQSQGGDAAIADATTGATPGATSNAALDPALVGADAPPAASSEITVDGLLEAWGQRGGAYDLDGNGTVNMADLLQLLAKISAQDDDDGTSPGLAPVQVTDARSLAAQLVQNLRANGFSDAPPANLREIVDRIGLPEGESKHLLAHLARHYPQGLGVNFTA